MSCSSDTVFLAQYPSTTPITVEPLIQNTHDIDTCLCQSSPLSGLPEVAGPPGVTAVDAGWTELPFCPAREQESGALTGRGAGKSTSWVADHSLLFSLHRETFLPTSTPSLPPRHSRGHQQNCSASENALCRVLSAPAALRAYPFGCGPRCFAGNSSEGP